MSPPMVTGKYKSLTIGCQYTVYHTYYIELRINSSPARVLIQPRVFNSVISSTNLCNIDKLIYKKNI